MDCGMVEKMMSRLQKKREKFDREGRLKIAFLGASLTRGEGVARDRNFVSLFQKKMRDHCRGRGEIEVLPFGESGTMSDNALFKVDRLIDEEPDIVFVDYAMNDTGDRYLGDCFEGLVYRMLRRGIAVVILMFCNNQGRCTRGAMERVGHHYQVPVFDIGAKIYEKVQAGMPWEQYGQDYVHPTEYGHGLIADYLCEYVEQIEKGEITDGGGLPERPAFTGAFWEYRILDIGEKMRGKNPGDTVFEEKMCWRMLLSEFFQDRIPNPASVKIYVDGSLIQTAEAFATMAWGNRVAAYVSGDGDREEHELRIVLGRDRPTPGWDYEKFELKLLLGE